MRMKATESSRCLPHVSLQDADGIHRSLTHLISTTEIVRRRRLQIWNVTDLKHDLRKGHARPPRSEKRKSILRWSPAVLGLYLSICLQLSQRLWWLCWWWWLWQQLSVSAWLTFSICVPGAEAFLYRWLKKLCRWLKDKSDDHSIYSLWQLTQLHLYYEHSLWLITKPNVLPRQE